MTGKTAKHIFVGVILIFTGVLAVVIGQRLGMDAMAVVVGVIIGIVASIPASIVFALITRQLQARDKRFRREHNQPPVVIIAPRGIAHFPRGDSDGRLCHPNPR